MTSDCGVPGAMYTPTATPTRIPNVAPASIGLSGGATAGIVVGVVIGLALFVFVAIKFILPNMTGGKATVKDATDC